MQFEVNGQNYFLNFVPEEGRWFLLKPTRSGLQAMRVVNDDGAEFLTNVEVEDPDFDVVN